MGFRRRLRSISRHEIRRSDSLGIVFGGWICKRIMAISRTELPGTGPLQRSVQDLEPAWFRCGCMDLAVCGKRTTYVRVHYKTSRGLFDVRHADSRETT